MQIREVMSRSVETLGPEATLREAAQQMRQADVGVMPVARDGEVLGVVTDRDIAVRAVAEGLDPQSTTVGQIMTTDVTFCHESDDLADAAAAMEQRQIRRLLVLDDNDRLCGIVSLGDLALRSGDDALTENVLEEVSRPTHPPRQVSSGYGSAQRGVWSSGMSGIATDSGRSVAMAAAGAAIGAGIMYLLDPQGGGRRRALIRDKAYSKTKHAGERLRRRTQDATNRARGLAAEASRHLHTESVDDQRLTERVRAHLGRVATHPRAIHVWSDRGTVTVSGPILADEADGVLSAIAGVPGVREVVDALERHDSQEGIPALQGPGRHLQARMRQEERWRLGSLAGAALGLAGLGMLGTALARRGMPMMRERFGASEDSGVRVHKSIEIDAPVEEVFAYWSNFENFPQFMRNVREVTVLGDGRSHWTVEGPAGATVEWDADICEWIEGQRIAWESAEDATVENAGVVTFTPTESGGTRVDVHLAYRPPAGALGHMIAKAFGSDPKSEMDGDLQRLKERIESQRAGGAEGGTTYRETIVAVTTTPAPERGNLAGGGASGGGSLGDAGLARGEPDTSDI